VASLNKMIEPNSPLTPEQRAQVELARTKLTEVQGALTAEERSEVRKAFKVYIKSEVRKTLSAEERAKMATMMARIPKIPDPATHMTPPAVPMPPDLSASPPAIEQPPVPPSTVTATPKPPFHFSAGPPGEKKSAFAVWLEKQVKEKIGEDGARAKLFLETLRSNIPAMMLCCIPLFAFILKILYIRKGRYYVEHLVYALHIHTFLYVSVIITSLAVMGANRLSATLGGLITAVMVCVIVVQIFLSIRRVYQQGWFMTMLKFLFGGFVYFVILVLAVGATALVTLILPS
jgi:hypothetical protein